MNLKRTKKGFTIVELVIVVGVIGILSAILIPTFVNLTGQAKEKALQLNLRNAYALVAEDLVDGFVGAEDAETPIALAENADYSQDKVFFATKNSLSASDVEAYEWDVTNRVYKKMTGPAGVYVSTVLEYNGYFAFTATSILA